MKKTISIMMALMLVFSLNFVIAQEIATQEDITDAGITPDSPFYGLDIAIEKITEIFGENIKLLHAKERLSEVKVMIQNNKLDKAEIGIQEFEKVRERIRDKTRIQEHKRLIDNLGQKISAIASVKGQLTDSQKSEIKTLIYQHRERIRTEAEEIMQVRNRLNK